MEENILNIDGLSREEARNLVISLERGKTYLVYSIQYEGDVKRKVFIETKGRKSKNDIKIYYETRDGEKRGFSYIEDILMDLMIKKAFLNEDVLLEFVEAAKDSIELVPIEKIKERYPRLFSLDKGNLPGHPFELMLVLLKWAGVQEDINYWGINPRTNREYEGRYKPYNALVDLFKNKMRFSSVLKKHRLC